MRVKECIDLVIMRCSYAEGICTGGAFQVQCLKTVHWMCNSCARIVHQLWNSYSAVDMRWFGGAGRIHSAIKVVAQPRRDFVVKPPSLCRHCSLGLGIAGIIIKGDKVRRTLLAAESLLRNETITITINDHQFRFWTHACRCNWRHTCTIWTLASAVLRMSTAFTLMQIIQYSIVNKVYTVSGSGVEIRRRAPSSECACNNYTESQNREVHKEM